MRWDAISGTFRVYEKGGGGGTTTSTQTVQNFSPEEAAARNAVQSEAQRIYNATSGQITNAPYPGATPAPASTPTLQGQNAALTAAGTQANMAGQLSAAQGFGLYDVLFPQTNPALRASVDAAIRPVTESYTQAGGVLSQIRDQATNAGGFNTRSDIAGGIAGRGYLSTVGDISARMHSDAYNKGLDTFSRTMALAPQNIQAQTAPAQTLSAVGQQQEAYQQQQLDYDAAVRQWSMNAPWAALQNYANIVYGGSTPGTSSTSFSSGGGGGGSTAMNALGGAAMGASIGSAIPGIGTAVGAGVGLMMGLFS